MNDSTAKLAFKIAAQCATHRAAIAAIIDLALADNAADADALIYEGEEMEGEE